MGIFSILARWSFPGRLKRCRLEKSFSRPSQAAALSPRRLEQRRVLDASVASLLLSPLGDTGEFVQVGEEGTSDPSVTNSLFADAPTVLSVTPNNLLITDADVGSGTFSIDVLFDEEMLADGSADPVLTFDPTVDSTLTFKSGTWSSDAMTYTATYDVADANVAVASICVTVTDARNIEGNPQIPSVAAELFDINTENLTIDSLTVTSSISENDEAQLQLVFSNPNSEGLHTVEIDWGDGSALETFQLSSEITTLAVSHRYLDDDPTGTSSDTYTVQVRVLGGGEDEATESALVTVNNVAPLNLQILPFAAIDENGFAQLRLTFDDPGTLDLHTIEVDWGDGSALETFTLDPGVRSLATPHRYLDDDPSSTSQDDYLVTVRVLDDDDDGNGGGVVIGEASVTVSNVAPTVFSVLQDQQIKNEGDLFAVSVEFADPGTLDTHTYEINWGDGIVTSGSITGRNFSASHIYADNGNYVVEIRVLDDDLGVGTTTFETIVENIVPELSFEGEQVVAEGQAFNLASIGVRLTDPGFDNPLNDPGSDNGGETTETFIGISIDWGDGTPLETDLQIVNRVSGSPGVLTTADFFHPDHTYADNGTYLVTVLFLDDDSDEPEAQTFTIVVNNVAPLNLQIEPLEPIDENGFTQLQLTFDDPGILDTYILEVNWGDGTTETFNLDLGTRSFSTPHQYLDDNPTVTPQDDYTIQVRVLDDDGGETTENASITVSNVAPLNLQILPLEPIDENGFAQLQLTFEDPGTLDLHTVEIDWGDGTPFETFTLDPDARSFATPHQYLDDNPTATPQDDYTIQVRVLDDDGGEATGIAMVAVRNVAPLNFQFEPMEDIFENGFAQLQFTFDDPGAFDTHTVTVDWGDGTIETFELDSQTRSFVTPHQYLDDNPTITGQDTYTINVTVTDDDGLQGSGSTTVLVRNVPPNQLVLTLTPNSGNAPPPSGESDSEDSGEEDEIATLAGSPAPLSTTGSSTPVAIDLLEGSDNPEEELLAALLGPEGGISVIAGSERFVGRVGDGVDPNLAQSATFSNFSLIPSDGTLPSIQMNGGGIFLTSGVANIPFTNTDTSFDAGSVSISSPNEGIASDTADLEAILVAAGLSNDVNNVNLLEFEFTVAAGMTSIEAEFVFGSDEFPDQGVTDVFAFIVDGTNFAVFPDGSLVSFVQGQNASNFNNNGNGVYGIEYDGVSNVLRVTGLLDTTIPDGGTHTLKIAIANTSDTVFDSGVFIGSLQAGTATGGGVSGGAGQFGGVVIFENDQVDLDISFFDVGTLDTFTIVIDWGDGTVNTIEDLSAGEFMAAMTHRYLDDDPTNTSQDFYTITATVIDDDLGQATGQVDVLVRNAAPTFGTESEGMVLTGTDINRFGLTTLTGSFNDRAGLNSESFTILVDWGDGSGVEAFAFENQSTQNNFSLTRDYNPLGLPPSELPAVLNSAQDILITLILFDDDLGMDTNSVVIGNLGDGLRRISTNTASQAPSLVAQPPAEMDLISSPSSQSGESLQGGVDLRSTSGESKAVSDRFLVIYEIDPEGRTGEEQKLEFDILDDLPALFRKLPDNHYKIDLIHEETDMRRPVLDIYVREGVLIDLGDDAEGTRDRPPADATSQEENGAFEAPEQPDEHANDFEEPTHSLGSALRGTFTPLQQSRGDRSLAPVVAGLVATSSFASWAQQVDRTVATAGSQKWHRLRWRNFPSRNKHI